MKLTINLSRIFGSAIFFFIVFCNLEAQHLTERYLSDNGKIEITLKDKYSLGENLFLISDIRWTALNDDLELVLAMKEAPKIVLYDSKGMQVRQVGSIGRGPGEYSKPSVINYVADTLYIWDSQQLKFLKYNSATNTPLVEIKDFRWAVQDFIVTKDDIYFYNTGKQTGPYIEEYNISDNKYTRKFGLRTQIHNVLATYVHAGGIDNNGNYVYYISPSSLLLHRIDVQNFDETSKLIQDSDFKIPEVGNARELISNPEKFQKVTSKSSIIKDMFVLNDYVLIMAEIGEDVYSKKFDAYLATNRKVRFYVLSSQMTLIDTFTFSIASDGDIQNGLWGANNNQLYLLSTYNLFGEEILDTKKVPLYYMYLWNISEVQK